ncbi:MAG: hypothetical protein H6697_06145 [Myxococcales bacterium]|nr:hypothetical protein [Myxococcales bacterium]MCB9520972.1 hypothetical protein [Myxococcales bacterium]
MQHRAAVAALALVASLAIPATASARPNLLRLWGQFHGTVASGQGNYFVARNGPYVGYGGQLGVQLIIFEAYLDMNVFDLGGSPGEETATMWNQFAFGVNFPIPLFQSELVRLFGRADITYALAPYDATRDPDLGPTYGVDNRGVAGLAGGGLEFMPNKLFVVGAAAYGGYHIFGIADAGDNGRHVLAQLYTRIELRI